MLSQAGEFSLVVLAAAAVPESHIINPDTAATLIAIVVLSLIATPLVHGLRCALRPVSEGSTPAPWINSVALREPGERLRAKAAADEAASDAAASPEAPAPVRRGHVIIAGFASSAGP